MKEIVKVFSGPLIILLCIIGLGFMIFLAQRDDNLRQAAIAELPGMTEVGQIAINPHSALLMREFVHPTRPEKTCLFVAAPANYGGLTCWDTE